MISVCPTSGLPSVQSDEELVRQSQRGCADVTERLLLKYRPLVESKARTFFLRGADHDDVVQEGMIGLFKAIRDFQPCRLAHFRAFADMCVTRQIITAVKSATRQKHLPLNLRVSLENSQAIDPEAGTTLLECLPDTQTRSPEDELVYESERRGRMEAASRVLSPLEMSVLSCYLDGLTYRETSDELCCQTKKVDNALQRIKRKLCEPAQFDTQL